MSRKRSKKGTYYEPHPLDFAILKRLPKEGTVLGYHTIATTVANLVEDLNTEVQEDEGRVSHEHILARMRSMHVAGFVAKVKVLAKGGTGWQRTQKGEDHYEQFAGTSLNGGSNG